MKNFKNITMMIFCLFAFTNVLSQTIVDHSFSYQGELIDDGVPANGEFDFFIHMVDDQGIETGTGSEHDNIQVTNGLFNLDVKIGGINGFEGFVDKWFEVSVRPGASTASYTVLSPVQELQAVPLATSLTKGSASTNQVLTFNGFGWVPADPVNNSPWTVSGSNVSYDGTVGIGGTTIANVDLFIDSDTGRSPLIARINNDPKFQINANGGTTIGFLLQTPPVDGLLVEGDVKLNQELNASDSGDADMKAYVYGAVNSAGTIVNERSSSGFTATKVSIGKFKIDFIDANINTTYIAFAIRDTALPNFTTTDIFADSFNVYMFDIAGNPVDDTFSFVVYRK